MRLLIQPDDEARPLIKAINSAKSCIEIVVFRFEQREIERALANAVSRGVTVNALIAHTNRAGEANLRKLELRLLEAGVTVGRTADDLVRYHDKLMIIDHRDLYLLAFNLTYTDIERSRSFGVVTRTPEVVREAERLFEADMKRRPYEPAADSLVVSPVNARRMLSAFIKGAKKELVIYDPKVGDPAMIRLLEERAAAGVEIRLIGKLTRKIPGVKVCKLANMRLHTRTMVRDRQTAFIGSQSLRAIELDARREVGLIFRQPKLVSRIYETFTGDWSRAEQWAQAAPEEDAAVKVAKKVAKLLAKDLPEVAPVLNGAVREVVGAGADVDFDPDEIEVIVKDAVREAVKEAVSGMVEDLVEQGAAANK